MKLTLPNGSSARGAQMGRRNILPDDVNKPIKLRMEKLRWVDGDYDSFGAYWGNSGDNVYCAWMDNVRVFVRATNRETAKEEVRDLLPNATFFR